MSHCGCRSQQCQPLCFWLRGLSSITQFSVIFWHDGPLLVYYCHGLSCFASGLLLPCFIMLRFRFTTVTGPLHVYYMSRSYPIKKIPLILLSVFYHHVSVLFSSNLLLFYFLFDTVILSQQGSLLFTTRVFLYTKQNDLCHG